MRRQPHSVSHCERQAEYSDHIFGTIGHGSIGWVTQKSGFTHGARVRAFKYRNKAALQDVWDVVMVNGRKSVTDAWVSHLTPAALAYWFMDDGSSVRVGYQKRYVRVTFATYSFTEEENAILVGWLNKFNLKAKVRWSKSPKHGTGHYIELSQSESSTFMDLVCPLVSVIPCMQYKLKYPRQRVHPNCTQYMECSRCAGIAVHDSL